MMKPLPPNRERPLPMVDTSLVEVYRAKDDIQAGLIKCALEADGIPAHVNEDSTGSMYPSFWWAGARILVTADKASEAIAILHRLEESRMHRTADPTAPKLPGGFLKRLLRFFWMLVSRLALFEY
jgi:hypothetical protein